MYLVSIYFDEKTNRTIQNLIDKVAKKTGNDFLITGKVPPHITVAAFETKKEEEALVRLQAVAKDLEQGSLRWVSAGTFLPSKRKYSPARVARKMLPPVPSVST